jgi:hypothetical protein
MYKEVIVDVSTNEVITQDSSAERVAEIEQFQKEQAELNAKLEAEAAAKAKAKQALLNRLGITADEAKLLLS